MPEPSHPERIGRLLDDYLDKLRRGQRPEIDEYVRNHPALADEIRETFSAVLILQNLEGQSEGIRKSNLVNRASPALPTGDIPQRIGDYRIVREIGRGGMGVVYEAVQESLSRTVALKVLPRQLFSQPKLVERFQREARAAASLHHTNIVPVFSVGQQDDVFHFAMQYIDGIGVDEIIKRLRESSSPDICYEISMIGSKSLLTDSLPQTEPLFDQLEKTIEFAAPDLRRNSVNHADDPHRPGTRQPAVTSGTPSSESSATSFHFRKIALMGRQAAEALQHAHDQGILHRDIKPSNLLVDKKGNVWVADFGLAKVNDTNMTKTGDIVGTLQYLPPERLKGIESASGDIFSLGLTLYEMVTLTPAYFGASQADLVAQLLHATPRRIREINSRVPGDLETIIYKSISPEPGMRYLTPALMAEDLECFLEGRPIRARRTGTFGRVRLWAKRNPVSAGLLSIVSLLLIALLVGSLFAAFRFANDNRLIVEHLDRSIAAEKAKSHALLESNLAQANALLEGTQFGKSVDIEKTIRNAVSIATELGVMEQYAGRLQQLVLDHSGSLDLQEVFHSQLGDTDEFVPQRGAFSKDLSRVARCMPDGNIRIEETSQPENYVLLPGKWETGHPTFYPFVLFNDDDTMLAARGVDIRGQYRVQVWNIADQLLLLDREADGIHLDAAVAFVDYARIAFGAEGRHIAFVDIESGETVAVSEPLTEYPRWIVDSRDGNVLVGAGDVLQIRQRDGTVASRFATRGMPTACAAGTFGKYVSVGYSDGKIAIWDSADSSRPLVTCHGHSQMVTSLSWHPQENLLLSTAQDGTTRLWDAEFGKTLLIAPFGGCQFSADGSMAGYIATGFCYGVWRVCGLDQRMLAYGHYRSGSIRSIDFSPDSRLIGWASESNGIVLSDLENPIPQRVYDQYLNHGFLSFTDMLENGFVAGGLPSIDLFRFEHNKEIAVGTGFHVTAPETLVDKYEWLRSISRMDDDFWLLSDGTAELISFDLSGTLSAIQLPHATSQIATGNKRRIIAYTDSDEPRDVRVWDLNENCLIGYWKSVIQDHATLSFDSLDRWLAVSLGNTTTLLETEDWTPVQTLRIAESTIVGRTAFSPDGSLLAITGHGSVTLYETGGFNLIGVLHLRTRAELATELASECCPICFSPDGRYLAAGTNSNNVVVWDMQSIRRTLRDFDLPVD